MSVAGHHSGGLSQRHRYIIRATIGIGHRVGVRTGPLGKYRCLCKAQYHH